MVTLFKRIVHYCTILLLFTNIFVAVDNSDNPVCVSANDENTYFEEINNNESGSIGSGDNGRYRGTGDSLPFEVDYSDLDMLETVKKGDIFFDSQGSVLAGRNYYHVAIVEDEDYNDDNINDMDATDSLVYKTFYANKTYLIVFGSYNPQYHNGVDTLSVRAR